MTPFSRLLRLYISAELSLLHQEKRNSVLGFLPFRRAARKTSDGGLVSSWQKRARQRTPSRCIMTVWMWKPSLTSVTLCGIPSCERHWGRGEPEGAARPLSRPVTFPFPSSGLLGGLHPPAVLPLTPGHTMKFLTRTCRCAVCAQTKLFNFTPDKSSI